MGLLHHPFLLRLVFRHFWVINFLPCVNYFVWLKITDKGLVPEMRIWSISLIKSDLKWCVHLSRSLYLYSKDTTVKIILCLFISNYICLKTTIFQARTYSREGGGVLTPWNFQNMHDEKQHYKILGIIRDVFVFVFLKFSGSYVPYR